MPLTTIETIPAAKCAKLFKVTPAIITRLLRQNKLTKLNTYGKNGRYYLIVKDDKFQQQLKNYQRKNKLLKKQEIKKELTK